MPAVFGLCPRCPKDSKPRRLYAGLCSYHYGHPDQNQSLEVLVQEVKDPHEKELLRQFYREQARKCPSRCENCNGKIITSASWPRSSAVCHIVPKRIFKSVMIHPLNRWFGCIICHHDYDDKGWTNAVTMKVWPVCLDRFREFMTLIHDNELRYLPFPLMEILNPTA